MPDVRVLAFGGCNIRAPIVRALHRRTLRDTRAWDDVPRGYRLKGPPFFTYTLGEMSQALACYRGERTIAPELLGLCNMRPTTAPNPERSPLGQVDVVLIEPNTSIEIRLDDVFINRRPVLQLMMPLRALGPEVTQLSTRWYEKGVAALNDDARRAAAAELLPLIPPDFPNRGLIVRVLAGAVGEKPPVRAGLEQLARTIDAPLGVALFAWAYMPDGRPLSWPSDFLREMTEATAELSIPAFDPRPLVQAAGVERALAGDQRHYADAFLPTVAKPLVEFTLRAAEGRALSSEPQPQTAAA